MSTSPRVSSASLASPSAMYPQFLLFGDSITEGSTVSLLAPLSQSYTRRLDVLNRGFGGYTAPMGLDALRCFFPSSEPSANVPRVRLMIIFFGANDSCLPGSDQHVPLETYKSALRQITAHQGLTLHETKVILITPPPIDEWQLDNASRKASNTALYARGCREVGNSLGLPVLDIWTIFMLRAGWRPDQHEVLPGSKAAPKNQVLAELLADGLHFTPLGYDILHQELVRLIAKDLPDETPDRLPIVYPEWRTLLGVVD